VTTPPVAGSPSGPVDPDEPQDILDSPHATQAVVRGGAWRVSSYLVGNGLAVLSAAVIVRYLGVQNLARYTVVVSLMTVISGVFEAGLTNLGVRESAVLDGGARRQFLRDLLGLRLVVAAVGIVVGVAIAVVAGYPHEMVAGTAVAGLGVVAYTLQSHYATALQTQLRLGWYSALEFIRQLAFTTFALLFVALDLGVVGLLAVSVPAQLAVLIVTMLLVGQAVPLGVSFAARRWRALLSSAVPVVAWLPPPP
jgi:O-antigen/teichoic acid export membrane protein